MKNIIFISHSSKDSLLIEQINKAFKDIGVEPYFAFLKQEGVDPVTKIINAIHESRALFVLVTENVLKYNYTRDWVSFEIGLAKGIEKGSGKPKRVYAWLINVDENEDELAFLRYITDYSKIKLKNIENNKDNIFDPKDVENLVNQIVNKARKIVTFQPKIKIKNKFEKYNECILEIDVRKAKNADYGLEHTLFLDYFIINKSNLKTYIYEIDYIYPPSIINEIINKRKKQSIFGYVFKKNKIIEEYDKPILLKGYGTVNIKTDLPSFKKLPDPLEIEVIIRHTHGKNKIKLKIENIEYESINDRMKKRWENLP
ncbi:toll/interleukin-1 receptor domain-containing protein [Candidatus Pyrohabitans sp.]